MIEFSYEIVGTICQHGSAFYLSDSFKSMLTRSVLSHLDGVEDHQKINLLSAMIFSAVHSPPPFILCF